MWTLDWARQGSTGTKVWCVNLDSPRKDSRKWKLRSTAVLRKAGVNTPTYRADSWDVDWSKRNVKEKLVWARNPMSKMPEARNWHWIGQGQVLLAGLKWKPLSNQGKPRTGRYITGGGYVHLSRTAMTQADVELCERFNLFRGRRKTFVREHHLVAIKKFGIPLDGKVVRHFNGIKSDNSEGNLLLGTKQENNMDHNTARIMAIYWHNKYDELLRSAHGK
jgi:hypothetical protein